MERVAVAAARMTGEIVTRVMRCSVLEQSTINGSKYLIKKKKKQEGRPDARSERRTVLIQFARNLINSRL